MPTPDSLTQLSTVIISRTHVDGSMMYSSPAVPSATGNSQEIDLTIFVPCYNEEENILDALDTAVAALQELACSWEIIIIDDASKDKTVELIKKFMCDHLDYPLILLVRNENQGLAQNYIEGAFWGRGKYYKLICGDNVESKERLVSVMRHIGEADMVLPYHVEVHGRSILRKSLSGTFTWLVNSISGYGIKYYNGVGVLLRYDVMRWNTNYHGFSFQADLITRLLDQGKTYVDVPTIAAERASGTSHALTMRNFLSVGHFFLDLAIRRIGRRHQKRKSNSP